MMDEPGQITISEESRQRLIRWGIFIAVLLVVFVAASSLFRLLADYWWYSYDAGTTVVFTTPLSARAILFAIGFILAAPLLIWNAKRALNAAMVFGRRPETPTEAIIASAMSWMQDKANRAIWIGGIIIAVLFGLSAGAHWEKYLLFRSGVPFGRTDPIFGEDYAFFVFRLPFLQAIVGWLISLWFISSLIALAVYFGMRAAAALARLPLTVPSVRAHLSVLAAIGFALFAVTMWLQRYEAATAVGTRFTGAGYAEMQAVGGRTITAVILALAAVASLFNARLWRPYVAIIAGAVASFAALLGGVVIWPSMTQSYRVNPNEIKLETPYIERAIEATRWAYSLNTINVVDFPVRDQPTEEEMRASKNTLDSMRLWDPEILRQAVDNLQSLRDYYAFQDIEVDRYNINGTQRMLMLGARNLVVSQLDPSRRNWQNLRLQYTHGNGVVAVPVNEASPAGTPVFFLSDIPPRGVKELAVEQPRLYYSDTFGSSGEPEDRYVFVRSRLPEFDFTTAGEAEHRWEYDGGIPISGFMRKLVYAFLFGDRDILFSNDLTSETRLLFNRNIRVRAQKLLPFLQWDNDPYITIIGGRLLWIMDGYTLTNKIPYSAFTQAGTTSLNYIRNSAKLTIDAYTGEWKAYQMDVDDPMIRAYAKIYPGLLRSASEAPAELRAHFRYPEDLFYIQAFQLTLYHVTDPLTFFRNEDAWQIPEQALDSGSAQRMKPYYVQMRLPGEETEGFLLILPLSPRDRPNMIGWLAAHCDPAQYAKLILYRFPRNKNINGPGQQEARFQTDAELSKLLTLLDQRGSELIHGNLLVVPIGESVMYVKTLFLKSVQTGIKPIPELKLIVLAYSNKIVFAETYSRALKLLMGDAAPTPAQTPDAAAPQVEGTLTGEDARRALELLEQGKQALRNGDWSAYGESQRKVEELLRGALR